MYQQTETIYLKFNNMNTETKKFTRTDYLNKLVSHNDYYAQFVTDSLLRALPEVKDIVDNTTLLEAYKVSENLNTISLNWWDKQSTYLSFYIGSFKEYGELRTLSTLVSVLKCACKIKVETYKNSLK